MKKEFDVIDNELVNNAIKALKKIFLEEYSELKNVSIKLSEGYKVKIGRNQWNTEADSPVTAIKKVLAGYEGWTIADEFCSGKSLSAETKEIIIITVKGQGVDAFGDYTEDTITFVTIEGSKDYKTLKFLLYKGESSPLLQDDGRFGWL